MYGDSLISTSSIILVVSYLFDDKLSDRYEVISLCSFNLYFLLLSDAEHLFMYLLASCMSSFGKCLFTSFVHFKIILPPPTHWIAWLQAFWILTYYQIYDLQIFSLILWVAFSFLKLIAMQKVLSLMWSSHLFLLLFLLLVSNPKNSCQDCHGIYFWYCLLGISWFGSHVQIFNLFCIDFCVWHKIGVWLPFLHVAVYFLQHHLLKKLFFLHFILAPLVDHWCANLFLGSLFYSIDLCVCFYVNTILLWFSSFQLLSHVQLFVTPWTTAHQASLSITNSRSLLKLISIESVMPSNHLILCHSLLFLPSFFTSIRVFSNESVLHIRWPKYWSFSFTISHSNE